MRLIAWICSFSFIAGISAQQIPLPFPTTACMALDQAKSVMAAKLTSRVTICGSDEEAELVDDFDLYDDRFSAGPYSCQLRSDIVSAVKNMSYDEETQLFTSGIAWSFYCAAGAECWGGYTLDCKGKLGNWFDGEE